ncbi:zinc-dependent alcohol dehydrogenase [Bacillus sp. JJ1562]|uniref:zinc-dependent alcohol dehydrogenase n=1 Tax=Bacillus sp. JJ1562 TaxID=3122960 RepID=UPI003003215B
MNATMKALVYEGPRLMNMRSLQVPSPREDEVLIKVKKVGICGSELSGYLGHNSLRKAPLVMGHEFSGTIEELGSKVSSFQVHNHVTVNPLISCLKCNKCITGKAHLCTSRQLLGAHVPGAFAEYVCVPERNVYMLPSDVSLDIGALAEPLACAVHVCRLANLTGIDTVLIIGAGPIGLFLLQSAKILGSSNIIMMDINKERLHIAEKLGASTVSSVEELRGVIPKIGVDIAIDAVGYDVTRNHCVEFLKTSGKVIFTGLHESRASLPVNDIIRKEINMQGAFAYTPDDFEIALHWLIERKVELLPGTVYLPIEEGQSAFESLIENAGNVTKVLLTL